MYEHGTVTHLTEIDLEFGREPPQADVRAFQYGGDTNGRLTARWIRGVVRVSSPSLPSKGDPPLLIEYDLAHGNEFDRISIGGRFALTADDVR